MSNYINTPLMNLPNPVPGVDPGPDYALNLQSCLNILDQHNHSPGSGNQINPSGIVINSDLAINSNNLTLVRSLRFYPQSAALAGASDIGCLYEAGVDLYYNDANGNQIRITQSGSVAGSTGTITGLPSGTASASYGAGTFVFQSATNTSAVIDGGSLILRNNTALSKGLTLSPPNAMGADYGLSLPALPAATNFLSIDTSGNIAAYAPVSQGLTGSNIASNVNLSGKTVQEQGLNVIVSNTNAATNSLSVVRGYVSSTGTIVGGEGFTVSHTVTGKYSITPTASFLDLPVVISNAVVAGTSFRSTVGDVLSSSFSVYTYNASGTSVDNGFTFIAIGQRA